MQIKRQIRYNEFVVVEHITKMFILGEQCELFIIDMGELDSGC